MNPFSYSVSLRIRHPTIDPTLITAALALEPLRQWCVGQPRTDQRGRPLEGTWPSSYWVSDMAKGDSGDLAESLARIAHQLKQHASLFAVWRRDRGSLELFIGLFGESGNFGDVLPFSLLADLAALGLDLSLDIYP